MIRFGEGFELDFQSYKLSREDRVLKLERIPMEILVLLIERRGEVVSREQIAERIWGKDVFLDTDNSINGAIRKIRQVLRDDSEQPRFIQTITGQGYRFIAPVVNDESNGIVADDAVLRAETPVAPQPHERETVPADVVGRQSSEATRTRDKGWVVYAALLILLIVAGWAVWSRFQPPQPFTGRIMLAVLPFENLTGDSTQEYFSDGLTEEMISQLGNLDPQHLGVIARTSVMHYKSSQTPLDQIGRELGAQYVLEGSVRRDANNVRITAQLIQMKDQSHVWARQYDRELKGLLSLQGEIAQEVGDEIQHTLGEHKSAVAAHPEASPQNYEAYDLYLKGQYFFNKRTVTGLEEAIGSFQQAAAKDPSYARAYAGLADCYALMAGYTGRPPVESIPKARATALRALQLDDGLPEAHTALALIVQTYDWDWQTAEREYQRAIALNPNYATAHHWYAEHLMWRGRFDEALQESERARQLDPLSLIIAADNGAILYFSRRYDQAIEKWRSVLELDPDFIRAHLIKGAYTEKGMFAEALADGDKLRPKDVPADYWSWKTYIEGRAGSAAEARQALGELLSVNRHKPVDPMLVANAYVGLGDKDQAFGWLEKAYLHHSNELVSLKVSPVYDALRGDPRFEHLLHRIGL